MDRYEDYPKPVEEQYNRLQDIRDWASYMTPSIGLKQLVLIPGLNIIRLPFIYEKIKPSNSEADHLVKQGQKIWRMVKMTPKNERIKLQEIFQVHNGEIEDRAER